LKKENTFVFLLGKLFSLSFRFQDTYVSNGRHHLKKLSVKILAQESEYGSESGFEKKKYLDPNSNQEKMSSDPHTAFQVQNFNIGDFSGPACHARCLTTATRILILYTREPEPSPSLCSLVNFIHKVHGVFWFRIKAAENFNNGLQINLEMIKAIQQCPAEIQQVALPAVFRQDRAPHPSLKEITHLRHDTNNNVRKKIPVRDHKPVHVCLIDVEYWEDMVDLG
jgi:hypothetical protein